MLNRYIKFIVFCFILLQKVVAQREPAREIIHDLCSDEMAGRGYVDQGHLTAAKYIRDHFSQLNLLSFEKGNYLQPFNINVNTFPKSVHVSLSGKELRPGSDYLIDPISGSAKGEYELVFVNNNNLIDFLSELSKAKNNPLIHNAVVLNATATQDVDTLSLFNELKYSLAQLCPVIWIKEDKFTWSVGKEAFEFPIIEVRDSSINNSSSIELDIENQYLQNITTHNLIGFVEGKRKKKFIVLSAHYDHLGMMGDAMFPGANDNASGTSMLLSLADYFSKNKPKYNVVFMAFGAEEVGILGSKYYTENPLFPLDKIKFLINMDIMGTGDEGITVVNGTLHKKQFKKLSKINKKMDYVPKVKIRGRAANSDHFWFSQMGVPAFFIYTVGGIQAYHDVYDRPETLPLTEFEDLHYLIIDLLKKM